MCSDGTDCTLCDTDTFYNTLTKTCDYACPSNTFVQYNTSTTNNDCIQCNSACKTCSGTGSAACTSCVDTTLFVNSSTAIARYNSGTVAGTIIAEQKDAGTCSVCTNKFGPIAHYCFPCSANCTTCLQGVCSQCDTNMTVTALGSCTADCSKVPGCSTC